MAGPLHPILIAVGRAGVALAVAAMSPGVATVGDLSELELILYLVMVMEVQLLLIVRLATLSPKVAAAIVLKAMVPGPVPFAAAAQVSGPAILPYALLVLKHRTPYEVGVCRVPELMLN